MAPTTGEKVIAFVSRYCRTPEGARVGRPVELLEFQKRFIRDVYDGPRRARRAYLSVGRKNGKSTICACLVLAHLVGPVAVLNSQIICGARSREQAAIIYKLADKMIRLNPDLARLVRSTQSSKTIRGLRMNTEFRAISAEAGTAHGLSPVVAILDEVGQIKGPTDDFVEAIETAQGAYDEPLLIAISTQAATDADLFSVWLDAAESDPDTVSHVYTAPEDCDLLDQSAWAAANPGLSEFRSFDELAGFARQAVEMPSKQNSFRWLYLNQRIDASSPFISRGVWASCGGRPDPIGDRPVFAGLDLSSVSDLTAFVAISPRGTTWDVHPTFWLPEQGLREKAKADRVPYDLWQRQGFLATTPGASIDYQFVAAFLRSFCEQYDVRKIAFDR